MREIQDQDKLDLHRRKFQLDEVFSEASLKKMKLFKVEKGEVLCSKGDRLSHMYFLTEGKMKIFALSPEGKALILRFKTPFAIIGDVEYVQDTEVFHTVQFVTEGYMIGIPLDDLRKIEGGNTTFLNFLLEIITAKFYTETNASTLNMLYSVDVRLASYLLSLSDDGKGSMFHEEMHTSSLQELADVLGTSYRHLNRILRQFHEDGILERKRGLISVKDMDRLREKADGNIYE
ncbi:Crp/Fnr family transcriptional regulator [Thalassobacillus hwangdonensis]|uniref:Crp/Fnr family transcriptional regulator n=1 Tax=Thalassobacillus hwangdonensis TaxID=546108 RepID=A0ABW3KXI6_9BACI